MKPMILAWERIEHNKVDITNLDSPPGIPEEKYTNTEIRLNVNHPEGYFFTLGIILTLQDYDNLKKVEKQVIKYIKKILKSSTVIEFKNY